MTSQEKTQIGLQNIADLCEVLLNGPKQFDMATIERCVVIEMQETGFQFRPYMTVLAENFEGYKQTSFDETEEYFFERLNSTDMNEGRILNLVKLCIS